MSKHPCDTVVPGGSAGRRRYLKGWPVVAALVLAGAALVPTSALAMNPCGFCPPANPTPWDLVMWQKAPNPSPWVATNVTQATGTIQLISRPIPLRDAAGTVHVFSMSPGVGPDQLPGGEAGADLVELVQGANGAFGQTDVSDAVGGVPIFSDVSPLLAANGDVHVFALAKVNNDFCPPDCTHLMDFVRPGGSGSWQVSDLTDMAGADQAAALSMRPSSIQTGGGDVHVYTGDVNGHLQEYFKPAGGSWSITDLTAAVGGTLFNDATPIEYGGNSIQIATTVHIGTGLGDLELVIEGNTPAAFTPQLFDLTAMAGSGIRPSGDPVPVEFGSTNQDLVVYADDQNGNLAEWFKAPSPGLWTVFELTSLSATAVGVAPLNGGAGVHVFTANGSTSHMLDVVNVPGGGSVSVFDETQAAGNGQLALFDPTVVNLPQSSTLEVFSLESGAP